MVTSIYKNVEVALDNRRIAFEVEIEFVNEGAQDARVSGSDFCDEFAAGEGASELIVPALRMTPSICLSSSSRSVMIRMRPWGRAVYTVAQQYI